MDRTERNLRYKRNYEENLPAAGVHVRYSVRSCIEEGECGALLLIQLDAVGGTLADQKLPDQLDLTILSITSTITFTIRGFCFYPK